MQLNLPMVKRVARRLAVRRAPDYLAAAPAAATQGRHGPATHAGRLHRAFREALAALIEPPPADTSEDAPPTGGSPAPAERMSGEAGAALPRTVVRIRAGGDRLPIFFVHDGKGETLLYRTLALKLDAGHAIYGLQPEMRPDGSYTYTRIVDMAAAHVRAMRSVQPEGPYLLTGLCAGGVIAFEMARQLEDAGQRVIFVGIMDAADVHAQERPFRHTQNNPRGPK